MGGSGDNRLLKILHIDPELNWGGGEAQVFGLLRQLAERGHQNDLLAQPRGQLFHRAQKLPVRAFPFVMRNDLDVRAVPSVRRRIRHGGYDIVHFHTRLSENIQVIEKLLREHPCAGEMLGRRKIAARLAYRYYRLAKGRWKRHLPDDARSAIARAVQLCPTNLKYRLYQIGWSLFHRDSRK